MNTIVMYMVPLIFITVGSIFGYIIYCSNKKAAIEKDKTPIYKERCAGKIGKLYYKGPFIRVALYAEFMVVSSTKQFVIQYSNIVNVSEKKRLLNKWIVIRFQEKGRSQELLLSSINPAALIQKITDAKNGNMSG